MAHASAAEKAKQQAKKRRKQNKPKITDRTFSDESRYLILKHDAQTSQLPAHKLKELEELERRREERIKNEQTSRVETTENEFAETLTALEERKKKYQGMIENAPNEQDAKKSKRMKRRGARMLKKVEAKIAATEAERDEWRAGERDRQSSSTSRSTTQA